MLFLSASFDPQQGAAAAAAQQFGGVSPGSSTPHHNSIDDSENSSVASLDEQFYTEAYPSKLCCFCNLSEKSFLGQGDMVKYTISESALKEFHEKKDAKDKEDQRVAEEQQQTSSGGERPKSPSSLNARRKIRKFISGDNNEPVDELEVIGYQEEVDVSLLFEATGVFYAHFNCALWSAGVSKSKTETPTKDSSVPVLKHVSAAVLKAIGVKCAHCKHYGASVACKASERFYHWPCAVASGAFLEKSTLTMVSVESYESVAALASTAAYLYYTGEQWKIGKVAEIPPTKLGNLLYCTTCGQHYLYSGAHIKITERIRGGWQCQKCKTCQNCRLSGHEDRYLLCDVCDGAYHSYCLRPQMSSVPKNGWKCKRCRRCTDCNSKTPGSGQSSRWHANYSVCDSCYQQRNKGLACPCCGRAYRHSAQREMMQCSSCRKHVHSSCDPEASEEKVIERRAVQFNYMYICKICKGQQALKSPSVVAGNAFAAPISRAYDDPSPSDPNDEEYDPKNEGKAGLLAAQRKKMQQMTNQSKPGFSWGAQKGLPGPEGVSTASSLAEKKKRVAEIRSRKGRTPKFKGMVGLQRPQACEGVEPEDENKMICVSNKDNFTNMQDICVMCGSLGNDLEGRLIGCAQCGQCYHPHCVNVKVTKVILQKGWRCLDCTVCEGCGRKHDEANTILCDDCDISYHIYCADPPLDHVPDGAWKCKACSLCQYCGKDTPGVNSSWFDSYSTCGPCHSLQQCPLCEEGYEDGELMVICMTCSRWCHGECDSIQNEHEAEICMEQGYTCQLCRPEHMPPPHIALRGAGAEDEEDHKVRARGPPSPPLSPDYPVYGGYYSNASYMLDGVMLSERGMQHLKSLTIEKDKIRRKRRMGEMGLGMMGMDPMGGSSHDNSLEGDDDDDDDPPIIVAGSSGHKDGEIVRPLPDGSAPDPPEGFTIVVKDNGLMVLRKRRYRDLKKVGIGGFLAKTRTPKQMTKKEEEGGEDGKPKKRPAWRPKKNKILVQYPEYIQDSFFGKDFMVKCPDKVEDDDVLPPVNEKKLPVQNDGKTIHLHRDALAALEELKSKEEAEKKEKEDEEAKARELIEAAAKKASEEAEQVQKELDALKKEAGEVDKDLKTEVAEGEDKTDEEMGLDDGMLPSDLFGEGMFDIFKAGADIDIDEDALEEAEENTDEQKATTATDVNNELAEGLKDMLGPGFNAEDMEDIFATVADPPKSEVIKQDVDQPDSVKKEITEESPSPMPSSDMETAFTIKNEAGTIGGPQVTGAPSPAQPQLNPTSPLTVGQPQTPGMVEQLGVSQASMLPAQPVMSVQPGMLGQQALPGQLQTRMMMPQQRPQMTLQQGQQMGIQQNVLNTQTGMIEPRMVRAPQQVLQQRMPGMVGQNQNMSPVSQPSMGQQPRPMQQQPQGQTIIHQQLPGQQGIMGQRMMVPGQPGQQPIMGQRPGMVQRPTMMQGQPGMMQQPGMSGALSGQRPGLPQPQQPGMGANPQQSMMQGPQQGMGPGGPQQQAQHQPGQSSAATPQSNTQSVHFQKWEADEPLGDQATIAMILYANINNPSLKTEYPNWPDRMKQIAKIWKNLPNEKRAPYVQRARENRTANRMNRGPVSILVFFIFFLVVVISPPLYTSVGELACSDRPAFPSPGTHRHHRCAVLSP